MVEQVESPRVEPQKIVALKFRARTTEQEMESVCVKGNRFAEIDQVLDDIFRNDRLRCA